MTLECYNCGMIRLVSVASVISTYQKPAVTVDPNDNAQTDLWASRLNVPRERLLEIYFGGGDLAGRCAAPSRKIEAPTGVSPVHPPYIA